MTRTALALFVALVVALAALALRATVTPEAVHAEIERTLSQWAGRPVALTGLGEAHLLPTPGVRFTGAALVETDGRVLATAEAIDVSLAPAALLRGATRPATVALTRPELRFAGSDLPGRAELAEFERRWAAPDPVEITIESGRIVFASRPETVEAIDAELAWGGSEGRLSLATGFRWRDAAAKLTLRGPTLGDTRRLHPADVAIAFEGPGVDLSLDGTLARGDLPRLAGRLRLALADPARLARWIGEDRIAPLVTGPIDLTGHLDVSTSAATLTLGRAGFGTTAATGALSLRWDLAEPLFAATLACDTIDLRDGRPLLFGPGWSSLPLAGRRPPLSLDLRLSARRVVARTFDLERAAASLHLAEGFLNAEIGEATLWHRPFAVVLRGEFDDDGLRAALRGTVRDLPMIELARFLDVDGVETGTIGFDAEATTRCARLGDCLPALETHLRATATDIGVIGFSPFAEVSRFHPIALAARPSEKKTLWTRADLDLRLRSDKARVETLEAVAEAANLSLSGAVDLASGRVDLAGLAGFPAIRLDPGRNPRASLSVPIQVGGTLRRLEIGPGSPITAAPSEGADTGVAATPAPTEPTPAEPAPASLDATPATKPPASSEDATVPVPLAAPEVPTATPPTAVDTVPAPAPTSPSPGVAVETAPPTNHAPSR